jgi:hypothetical protein
MKHSRTCLQILDDPNATTDELEGCLDWWDWCLEYCRHSMTTKELMNLCERKRQTRKKLSEQCFGK